MLPIEIKEAKEASFGDTNTAQFNKHLSRASASTSYQTLQFANQPGSSAAFINWKPT